MFAAVVTVRDYRLSIVELNKMEILKKKYGASSYIFLKPEEWKRFDYLRHVANSLKSKEEFEEYCEFAKRLGIPKPNRNSKIRPLHEKYDNDGNLINPDYIIK